ncbi:unnamed protein product [Mycena citricolor]|uniref:Uncharacterized protein n=1 Tax=Mycena citricolor TaxID=2018698 RepID=A0AAD2H7X9_9AGAR|nr:unnamed protein product [Mycena citricolor]
MVRFSNALVRIIQPRTKQAPAMSTNAPTEILQQAFITFFLPIPMHVLEWLSGRYLPDAIYSSRGADVGRCRWVLLGKWRSCLSPALELGRLQLSYVSQPGGIRGRGISSACTMRGSRGYKSRAHFWQAVPICISPMFRALLIFAFLAVAIASPAPRGGPADVISAVGVIKDKCTVLDNGVKDISSPATGTQILSLEFNVLGVQNALKSAQQTLTGATLSATDCATWSDAVHGTVPIISTTLNDFNAKKSALPSAVKVVVCSNAKSLQSSCDTYMNSAKGLCPERKDQWVSDQAALDQSFKGLLDPSGFNCV